MNKLLLDNIHKIKYIASIMGHEEEINIYDVYNIIVSEKGEDTSLDTIFAFGITPCCSLKDYLSLRDIIYFYDNKIDADKISQWQTNIFNIMDKNGGELPEGYNIYEFFEKSV